VVHLPAAELSTDSNEMTSLGLNDPIQFSIVESNWLSIAESNYSRVMRSVPPRGSGWVQTILEPMMRTNPPATAWWY